MSSSRVSTDLIQSLTCLRILTRDKENVDLLKTREVLLQLIEKSNLKSYADFGEVTTGVSIVPADYAVNVEALKCLNNLVYNASSTIGDLM